MTHKTSIAAAAHTDATVYGYVVGSDITRANLLKLGAADVKRADDNSGTWVLDSEGLAIAFIDNTIHRDNIWLYYSSDVRDWLWPQA